MRQTVSDNVFALFADQADEVSTGGRPRLVIDRFDQWSIRAEAAVALTGACYCRVEALSA
ncbi:hypothetical protein [Saccharothrix hoggarensis]|uniref:Uncharacterized protein n=1 Tax=Saccharothrix hoggarensis TaxID=913853 RepID=A0ABW3R282_9PSEU